MKNSEIPQYYGRDLEAMSFAVNYHKWIIDEFKQYFGDRVAEIGAGTGNFSRLLVEHTNNLVAFEPSVNMYRLLEKRVGKDERIHTINSFFSDQYQKFESSLDSVIYVNVLEHIENDVNEITCMHKALKAEGHALIFVPAISLLFSDLDKKLGHFRRYHKKPLIKLVQNSGFKIVKIRYFDMVGAIPWYVAFVLLKMTLTGSNVSIYDKLIVPLVSQIERVINPPFGKNLLVIAKKS